MKKEYGIKSMMNFASLPLLKDGVKVQYEGSIDKTGYNADWDWWLYKEGEEWVIFDAEGPGCIYNFVQHRYPSSEEPTFRFYFDGEKKPAFEIRPSEFGFKPPFTEPLAGQYLGPEDGGRGPIRVVRSFVPMPYQKSCKITSSLQLKGFSKEEGDGGWGHVVYHSYSDAEDIVTFTGEEDYSGLEDMLNHVGEDPKPWCNNRSVKIASIALEPEKPAVIFKKKGGGSIASVKMMNIIMENAETEKKIDTEILYNVWLRATWDNHPLPDINCPLGVFFGNELGYNPVKLLSHGITEDGMMYQYFPMPYWESARIELINHGSKLLYITGTELQWTEEQCYPRASTGYFRSSKYYGRKAVEGSDSIIGQVEGRGHMVAAHVTAIAGQPGMISCEGDVRVHIDGIETPQVESDGSESWICYGWGFATPPQMNSFSGYDGLPDNPWSMVRMCLGDWYPFQMGLRFGVESGESNNQYLEHSGILFYYGIDKAGMVLSDELDIGEEESERAHGYRTKGERASGRLTACYEGDNDHILIEDFGREIDGYSEFQVKIHKENAGVRLRRRSDQFTGRQRAAVYIDGVEVKERNWYFADRNPYKRWLEDEFEIPAQYTRGKTSLTVRIEYTQDGESRTWNEFYYWVYSYF